jgi:uncharacterized protein DUF3892
VGTFSITAVHVEPALVPRRHEHIAPVKLAGQGRDYSRGEIIYAISKGDRFVTNAIPQAHVIVHHCHTCNTWDYITTAPDYTPENNLLSLPRY